MRLEVDDLQIAFGDRRVVTMAHLDVDAAEIVGLVGESGSGKSMTALAILGLAESTGATVTGSIRLDGTELVGASQRDLRRIRGRRIAMIFQAPIAALNPVMRVGTLFRRTLRLHGAGDGSIRERAASSMREVRLSPELLRRYPHQLSGGQAQRVAIALALALRADVLLADEPTSALDVTVQAEILDLVRSLRDRDGISVLFISHDLAVVAELCQRVSIMRGGEVLESGPVGVALAHPQHAYTRELLAAAPRLRRSGSTAGA